MKKYLSYLTWVPAMLLIGCMQDSEWKTNQWANKNSKYGCGQRRIYTFVC